MANYEEDVITISDGDIITVGPHDKILGMSSDASTFVILRWIAQR